MTIQNAKSSCHVTILPPPLYLRGQRSITPKNGGAAYRGTGSTKDKIAQGSTNCKENKMCTCFAPLKLPFHLGKHLGDGAEEGGLLLPGDALAVHIRLLQKKQTV